MRQVMTVAAAGLLAATTMTGTARSYIASDCDPGRELGQDDFGQRDSSLRIRDLEARLRGPKADELRVESTVLVSAPAFREEGFVITGANAGKIAFRKIVGDGRITFAMDAPCAIKMEDLSEFTGSLRTNRPLTLGGDYGDVGTSGVIWIPEGRTFTVAAGETWTSDDLVWVDGTLIADGTLECRRIGGRGRILCSARQAIRIPEAAARVVDGDRARLYGSLETAIAEEDVARIEILDDRAVPPEGYKMVRRP